MIKTSKHSIKFANAGKKQKLAEFLTIYNSALSFYIDYFWNNKIVWGKSVLDVKNNKLDVPPFISTTSVPKPYTELSARVVQLVTTEALWLIKSQTEKRRKQLYILASKMRSGDTKNIKPLQSKIDSQPLVKPSPPDRKVALFHTTCCQFIPSNGEFDGFLKLKSLGKVFGTISIPIKFTKHTNLLRSKNYKQMTTWRVTNTHVMSTWELDPVKTKGDRVLGADQGLNTCLSLSDGQTTQKCPHGHDLKSIIERMGRKKYGSKAFKRCQVHRTNYINYSINRLNLSNVSELRLEKLRQMRSGKRTSSVLNRWTYTQINAQIISRCEELGVPVKEQSSAYRSQRCSRCGWTQKSNRKGKEFICKSCGEKHDADINGALNHEADLYQLPFGFYKLSLNRSGFFWTTDGVYDEFGQVLTVPDVQNTK